MFPWEGWLDNISAPLSLFLSFLNVILSSTVSLLIHQSYCPNSEVKQQQCSVCSLFEELISEGEEEEEWGFVETRASGIHHEPVAGPVLISTTPPGNRIIGSIEAGTKECCKKLVAFLAYVSRKSFWIHHTLQPPFYHISQQLWSLLFHLSHRSEGLVKWRLLSSNFYCLAESSHVTVSEGKLCFLFEVFVYFSFMDFIQQISIKWTIRLCKMPIKSANFYRKYRCINPFNLRCRMP